MTPNTKPLPLDEVGIFTLIVIGLIPVLIGWCMYHKFKKGDEQKNN